MKAITLNGKTLDWGSRTYIMGILNMTPDSFSGDGILSSSGIGNNDIDHALAQARIFLESGADILDVGGESTRPGSEPVKAEDEMKRVLPVIEAIAAEFPEALISIDTFKASVAEKAFAAGARILNDVWALRADPELPGTAARHKVPVVLMHNRSSPANIEVRARLGSAYAAAKYDDLLADVKQELMGSVRIAREAGIPEEHLILDPGIGFGKTVSQNLELIDRLNEIRELGFPVLLGASRKSFIGYTLDLPPDQRVEGTAAAVAVGIVRGADIIRVHDVKPLARVSRMADSIVRHPISEG